MNLLRHFELFTFFWALYVQHGYVTLELTLDLLDILIVISGAHFSGKEEVYGAERLHSCCGYGRYQHIIKSESYLVKVMFLVNYTML